MKASDERDTIAKEREAILEKVKRLSEQYRELMVSKAEYEYHRRRFEVQLASLELPPPPPETIAGEELDRLYEVWEAATKEEQAELVKMVFDVVYVDTKAKEIVAYKPKEPYRALFRLCQGLKEKNGLLVTSRYDHVAGIGDPEGARGRQYLWSGQG